MNATLIAFCTLILCSWGRFIVTLFGFMHLCTIDYYQQKLLILKYQFSCNILYIWSFAWGLFSTLTGLDSHLIFKYLYLSLEINLWIFISENLICFFLQFSLFFIIFYIYFYFIYFFEVSTLRNFYCLKIIGIFCLGIISPTILIRGITWQLLDSLIDAILVLSVTFACTILVED